jgi:hypothetical protein
LARGARTGVRSTLIPSAARTASNAAVNFVPVAEQQPEAADTAFELHEQVAGLLRHPIPNWMRRDTEHMDPPSVRREHEQHVQPLQQHRVHGEDVDGQHTRGLCPKDCRQETADLVGAGSTPARCRMAHTVLAPILPW